MKTTNFYGDNLPKVWNFICIYLLTQKSYYLEFTLEIHLNSMEIDICTWLFIATLLIIAQYSKVAKDQNRRYVE